MRDVGIGGAYIGIIGGQSGQPHNPQAPADLSDAWWDLIIHAVREGTRTGVNIGLFNGPGWSQSGGPWVKPEQSMRYLAHTEIRVTGPKKLREKLPTPEGVFQQVAVLAYPAPQGDATAMPIRAREKNAIHFESPEPFTARSLTLHPNRAMGALAELHVSDDGQGFPPRQKVRGPASQPDARRRSGGAGTGDCDVSRGDRPLFPPRYPPEPGHSAWHAAGRVGEFPARFLRRPMPRRGRAFSRRPHRCLGGQVDAQDVPRPGAAARLLLVAALAGTGGSSAGTRF